jgi:hypothetical protein
MDPFTGLHAGFLVGGEHVLVIAERDTVEGSGVQVKQPACLDREVGVA